MFGTSVPPLRPFGGREWLKYQMATVFVDNGVEMEGRNVDANIQAVVIALQSEGNSAPPPLADYSLAYDAMIEWYNVCEKERLKHRRLASDDATNELMRLPQPPTSPKTPNADFMNSVLAKKKDLRCDHCKLPSNLPPFYMVRGPNQRSSGIAEKYGSLVLGIKKTADIIPCMWQAVALLRPRLAEEKLTPHAAEEHFTRRIGPPPWMEYFAIMGETMMTEQSKMKERAVRNAELLDQLQHKQTTTRQRIAIAKKLLQLNSPDDERHRIQFELQGVKSELLSKKQELESLVAKNRRDLIIMDFSKALCAARVEEIRRCCSLLTDEVNAREAVPEEDAFAPSLDVATVRNKLLGILLELPSSDFGRSTKRQQQSGTFSQCKDCLLLHSYSPFCTRTGDPHVFCHAAPEEDVEDGAFVPTKGPDYDLSSANVHPMSRQHSASLIGGSQSVRKKGGAKNSKNPPDVDATLDYMNTIGDHLTAFLAAAVRKDFKEMRDVNEAASSGVISQKFPSLTAQLAEAETMFHDWLSLTTTIMGGGKKELQLKDKRIVLTADALKAAELRIHLLRREIREMNQALAKRPNAKSNGVALDTQTFGLLVAKINDLHRKNAALKIRINKTEAAKKRQEEPDDRRGRLGNFLTAFSMLKAHSVVKLL